jgi:hypothetical protein
VVGLCVPHMTAKLPPLRLLILLTCRRFSQRAYSGPVSRLWLFPGSSTMSSDPFKETDYPLGGIRSFRISVGSLRIATRPRMA